MTAIIGVNLVGMDSSHDRQTILDIHIIDGMAANQNTAGLDDHLGATAENFTKHVDVPALGEADDIHGSLDFTAHGINVTQGIGGCNFTEDVGVIHHGGEKVNGLNDTNVVGNFIYGSIVGAVKTDQKIGIKLALGQLA